MLHAAYLYIAKYVKTFSDLLNNLIDHDVTVAILIAISRA